MIPQAAPNRRVGQYRSAILAAIEEVVSGDEYILGSKVKQFEQQFARYCNVAHCVAVNSGTDALAISLKALGIGRGDEVITVAMTAPGTALAIRQCDAQPHFVDIDPVTRCLDSEAAARAVNSRTKAIVPVHLHGHPMDMSPVLQIAQRHGLHVIEDCAQAAGARREHRHVGSFGHVGAFSFYPTKNLGCIGDGGAIVTNDDTLAATMRSARSFETQMDGVISFGFNSRLDELQASILLVLLPLLDEVNQQRSQIARWYRKVLSEASVELPPDCSGCTYHQFAITHENRDEVRRRLQERGVATGAHYARPLHQHPAFADCPRGPLPATESFARRAISLPSQPEVVRGHENQIGTALCEALDGCRQHENPVAFLNQPAHVGTPRSRGTTSNA